MQTSYIFFIKICLRNIFLNIPIFSVILSYCYEDERGIFPEVEFVYDLELPQDFKPVASDGEVSEFYSWPVEEVCVNHCIIIID